MFVVGLVANIRILELIPGGSIALLLPLIHWARNTPNIAATVTPPILFAVVYCLIFVYGKEKMTGT